MTSYQVTVTREGPWWVADITGAGVGPAATDVEHFADLDVEVRDLVAGLTGADPDTFDLTWSYVMGGRDVTDEITRLADAERKLADATRIRERERRTVLSDLRSANLSQATIADVLGLSPQRVHQLLHDDAA